MCQGGISKGISTPFIIVIICLVILAIAIFIVILFGRRFLPKNRANEQYASVPLNQLQRNDSMDEINIIIPRPPDNPPTYEEIANNQEPPIIKP